ncbi:MAG TPA: hypothetical protein VGG98_05845 [Solirubrobacteraceae bacterium]
MSAAADPYTGIFVYDSEFGETEPWQVIGGTSVASPIVASIFALAGGAHGVEYPARTLYENEARPGSFHDVLTGSNGACSKPANAKTGLSGCSFAEERADCSGELICDAGIGYDGPTGVGSPNGVAAFQPPPASAGGGSAGAGGGSKVPGEGGGSPPGSGAQIGGAAQVPSQSNAISTGASAPSPVPRPVVRLSALTLTHAAFIALAGVRPTVSLVSFTFKLSAAARVRASLARWVLVRGRMRWILLPVSLTTASVKGRNRGHLIGRRTLNPGRYRLTISPAGGSARSIVFSLR